MEKAEELELLQKLRYGDAAALKRLFTQHYRWLVAEVFHLIRDEAAAEDLVQDVFTSLWQKRESLEIHASISAYLKRAAVNTTLNYIKSRKRLDHNEPETYLEQAAVYPAPFDEEEDPMKKLMQEIDNLPVKCRIVFLLSRMEELSHKEIAEKLGISTKTIENQITKALKLLRERVVR